jgi:hypothetical protein
LQPLIINDNLVVEDKKETQTLNSSARTRQKKTKETMLVEPLPIFDCMYCVKNSKLIFMKMSEHYLSQKYSVPLKK